MLNISRRQAQAHRNIILAFGEGKKIQYRFKESDAWLDMADGSDLCLRLDIFYRVKPEPKYRPFSSAEEFKPHRERWVISNNGSSTACGCVHHYSDSHVAFTVDHSIKNIEWSEAFAKLLFDDGTPFGVLCEE